MEAKGVARGEAPNHAPAGGPDGAGSPQPAARVLAVDEGYELWAATYDQDPNPLLALEDRTLLPLLPRLEGKRALDVACGTGRWLERLLVLGTGWAMGIDRSPAMLEVAARKPRLRGRLVRGDCLALPSRSEVADFVICSLVLGHLYKPEPLAGEIARVTKAGADVYVTDLHPQARAQGWRTVFRAPQGPCEVSSFDHSAGRVRQSFESRGFRVAGVWEPCFGEHELPFFVQAGKSDFFPEACKTPALIIWRFQRRGAMRQAA